jgi:hypothetical protein
MGWVDDDSVDNSASVPVVDGADAIESGVDGDASKERVEFA